MSLSTTLRPVQQLEAGKIVGLGARSPRPSCSLAMLIMVTRRLAGARAAACSPLAGAVDRPRSRPAGANSPDGRGRCRRCQVMQSRSAHGVDVRDHLRHHPYARRETSPAGSLHLRAASACRSWRCRGPARPFRGLMAALPRAPASPGRRLSPYAQRPHAAAGSNASATIQLKPFMDGPPDISCAPIGL